MSELRYKRLPGRGASMSGYDHLWLGPDHLLLVHSTGYTETYKRFFFNEIQAFIVRRTRTSTVTNIVLSVVVLSFGALALAAGAEAGVFLGGVAVLCLLGLIINAVQGPSCVCHIRTAIQTEQLSALKRVRSAAKLLARIRPLIAEAQGTLTQDQLAAYLRPVSEPAADGLDSPGPDSGPPAASDEVA